NLTHNLRCDVKEKDQEKKEPEQQTTLFENDSSRKVTYKQKQVVIFLVQRNPSQRIKMGTRGGMLKEYQLPYKNALRVPIFTPSKAVPSKDLYRSPSPSEYKSIMEFETIAKGDLPKVSQPIRVNFRASSLISPTSGAAIQGNRS
uniref:Uncharacterized protein n=1 Tax=Oncorhynchus kisutch TaxID=8019 RepID=A0A8C7F0M0_ONCKI